MPVCANCADPLVLEIHPHHEDEDDDDDDDDDDTMTGALPNGTSSRTTVPDDVTLPCACHFHWECLLDAYELDRCPSCGASVITAVEAGAQRLVVDLQNEGGLQEGIDILPILKEESYLHAYPEERKCRAFLEFCREGDHRAIAEVLKSCAQDAEGGVPDKTAVEVLRYQDPMGGMQSGLHAAAANGHREVAWMLLLLASSLPELEFPALVYQEAAALGVMREDEGGQVDIRSLRDSQGRTAEDIAREVGVIWNGWIGNGRLALS